MLVLLSRIPISLRLRGHPAGAALVMNDESGAATVFLLRARTNIVSIVLLLKFLGAGLWLLSRSIAVVALLAGLRSLGYRAWGIDPRATFVPLPPFFPNRHGGPRCC